jgi:N12 class adenine-specific DNA methylase
MVGVELDPTTARIAGALYPSSHIRAEGFEKTRMAEGSFAATVGNVPFGKVTLHDPAYNGGRHSIHNHFIIKSLRLTAPGGLVAVVTSRYTLDAQSPAARREMARYGDLVGAIRLPSGAHRRVAGTEVVTDLLVLRRHDGNAVTEASGWERTVDAEVDGGTVRVNQYFADHPEMVVGTLYAGRGMYGDDELMVRAPEGRRAWAAALAETADHLIVAGLEAGLTSDPKPVESTATLVAADRLTGTRDLKPGAFGRTDGNKFVRQTSDGLVAYEPPATRRKELGALVDLRDTTLALIDAQAQGADPTVTDRLRGDLNRLYDTYVSAHGPLGRWKWTQPKDPSKTPRRSYPALGGFRHDPDFPTLRALEDFDDETQTVVKMPIFTTDVVAAPAPVLGADTAEDALAICWAEHARVDLDVIGDLLGVTPVEAREQVADLVFDDPELGTVQPGWLYLSGDVRSKLRAATEAAGGDRDRWSRNVAALEAVLPPDLTPEEIEARPGATWIPDTDVSAFMTEVLGCPRGQWVDYRRADNTWLVGVNAGVQHGRLMRHKYGTRERSAVELLDAALNQRPVTVTRTVEGQRVVLAEATAAARERQGELVERFGAWVWEDPARSERLQRVYNDRFNAVVPAVYDGSHLRMPGLSAAFKPHPHQLDAVARVVAEPTTLLDHVVGAGKTGTMIMAGMEMRRLGLVRQPWYVVPNHMLEQFSREFKQWYPAASVLVGSDLKADGRKEFVARTATGDWDAVVVTLSAFKAIPLSEQSQAEYLQFELDSLSTEARYATGEGGSSKARVKNLEGAKLRLEQRIAKLLDHRTDDGVTFEQTGCDYLFVDEAHAYKNKRIVTGMKEFAHEGSGQAEDMAMKLDHVRNKVGSDRAATFATGTPVTNSLRELYVMQSFLRPEALVRAEIEHFDAWAANFCRTVTTLELEPSGAGYRVATRMARFANVPDLVGMYREFADVASADDIALPVPALRGGERTVVPIEPSDELVDYIDLLGERAKNVGRQGVKGEDNTLVITNDGRMAALDPRTRGLPAAENGGKLTAVAGRVIAEWEAARNTVYLGPDGNPSPRPGGFQVVFCDRAVKGGEPFDFHTALGDELVAAGMAPDQVAFIHDYPRDSDKARLFAACRDGRVSVLIGTTEKMGTGTNIQARMTALHHVDCPWRPSDLEQREGRAIRQGNQNAEVGIYAYATKGSFDVFMWQTVERKQRFIGQLKSGDTAMARSVDDLGDEEALSYAEIKALASGNPLILEQAGLESEVTKLERLRKAHLNEQRASRSELTATEHRIDRAAATVRLVDKAIPQRVDTRAGNFRWTQPDGTVLTERADAVAQLELARRDATDAHRRGEPHDRLVGSVGGFDIHIRRERNWEWAEIEARDLPGRQMAIDRSEGSAQGVLRSVEHRIAHLEGARERAVREGEDLGPRVVELREQITTPFKHQADLDIKRERLGEVTEAINREAEPAPGQNPTPEGPTPRP